MQEKHLRRICGDPERDLALKPENISFEEAAAATMAAQIAWISLVHYGKIKKGEVLRFGIRFRTRYRTLSTAMGEAPPNCPQPSGRQIGRR